MKHITSFKPVFLALTLMTLFTACAFAADKGVVIQSAASYQTHNAGTGVLPLGGEALVAAYPVNGAFPVAGTGSCAYTTACQGISIVIAGNTVHQPKITYASPGQINFQIGQVVGDAFASISFYRDNNLDRSQMFYVQQDNMQTFVKYDVVTLNGKQQLIPLLQGTLYGYLVNAQGQKIGATALKPLHDGKPNPRTFNGFPTIIQAYASGDRDWQSLLIRFDYNGYYAADLRMQAQPSGGVVIVNLLREYWDAGLIPFRLLHGGQVSANTAFVLFAD